MVLTSDDPEKMEKIQQYLATKFKMKDLGQMRYLLGIEVSRSRKEISLS